MDWDVIMLFLKKEYFDAVRAGTKTTTLRFWRHRRVRPGSVHWVRGLGQLYIESVRLVELDELTDADAGRDGFENLSALRLAMDEHYPPEQRAGRQLYLVEFRYLPE